MLIEKEIIAPGTYFYTDEQTGLPRKLDVTPELCRYWHEQGSKMLSAGLTVPVPFEHDFSAHPMTPKDKLLNNAGEVKEYRLKDFDDPKRGRVKDALFGVVDVQDPDARRKIGHSIRWTSPWINSFTDGDGKQWNNVISHLALTTRPRITKQSPFGSVAAALSMATTIAYDDNGLSIGTKKPFSGDKGFCLSTAGRLVTRKKDKRARPMYPIAFSMLSGGVKFGEDDDLAPLRKKKPDDKPDEGDEYESGGEDFVTDDDPMGDVQMDDDPSNDASVDLEPFNDPAGDVKMEELLCDLLSALGIHCQKSGNEDAFKRSLYNAAMTKIHELTAKGRGEESPDFNNPNPTTSPAGGTNQPNPLIQQEQQPMYMSLEAINQISDPTMRTIALSMYNENSKLRAEMDSNAKVAKSLQDDKLREANAKRASRVQLLGRLSPRVKADLDAMATNPGMALSLGDGGAVVDPMAQTLAVLEKGLADMPRLLTADVTALSVQPHPTDGEMLGEEADKLADNMARMMGCPVEQKRAS